MREIWKQMCRRCEWESLIFALLLRGEQSLTGTLFWKAQTVLQTLNVEYGHAEYIGAIEWIILGRSGRPELKLVSSWRQTKIILLNVTCLSKFKRDQSCPLILFGTAALFHKPWTFALQIIRGLPFWLIPTIYISLFGIDSKL